MTTIEIARRMAQLGEKDSALKAYALALNEDRTPAELLEAAAYTLDNGGDYKLSYTTFVGLYNAGHYREQILPLMSKTFYQPNIRLLKSRYERNVKLLTKYPYLFRKDFVPFDDLPLIFFPYDDHNGYVPFDTKTAAFRGFVNVRDTVITHYFFKDLEKPILAHDIFSQYELEYLVDNVRPSEWVGRENHIYLHYTDWTEFCAWLTVLTMKPLVESKKIVFLIEDEIEQYPIDFKERFKIDYSQYPVKPVGIREINKLIWHTQFSTHNGGDFFNEIFDEHPNLICLPSLMMDSVEEAADNLYNARRAARTLAELESFYSDATNKTLFADMFSIRDFSKKDAFVSLFLLQTEYLKNLDTASRIAPALFFQPHFPNMIFTIRADKDTGRAVLDSEQMNAVSASPFFKSFKYIKTFTPLRRFTTSHGGTVRFMLNGMVDNTDDDKTYHYMPDVITQRVLNRSFMRDPDDRLYHDSIIVRFEDGKLNPRATLPQLAAFLDIPYTESMTYCSEKGKRNVVTMPGNVAGFNAATVYRTYDEYVNDSERKFIEFFLRDAYGFYCYDFQWYDGSNVDEKTVDEWVDGFTTLDGYMRETLLKFTDHMNLLAADGDLKVEVSGDLRNNVMGGFVESQMEDYNANRKEIARILLRGLRFVNKRGQPLEFTPMLQPDPDLLDQPLYH